MMPWDRQHENCYNLYLGFVEWKKSITLYIYKYKQELLTNKNGKNCICMVEVWKKPHFLMLSIFPECSSYISEKNLNTCFILKVISCQCEKLGLMFALLLKCFSQF